MSALRGDGATSSQHEARLRPLAGLTPPLIAHLAPMLSAGSRVLDAGCGIGEPSIEVATTYPEVEVVGVDVDIQALEHASTRARQARLSNLTFERMDMEHLTLQPASVDCVVSRLGALAFGDVDAVAGELARVLRPGAELSAAVWDGAEGNPYMRFGLAAVERVAGSLSAAGLPDVRALVSERSNWSTIAACLRRAGFDDLHTESHEWTVDMTDVDELWAYCTSGGPLDPFFEGLDDVGRERALETMAEDAGPLDAEGLSISSRCRLVFARRV